jgi:hypothetical protein
MNSGTDMFVVGRRRALQVIFTLPILPLVGGCEAAAPCPLCGGRLSTVGAHIDFRFLPSVNYAVWNRASDHVGCTGFEPGFEAPPPERIASNGELEISCGPEFNSESLFCQRCFHAFSQRDQQWKRTMNTPQSFFLPLSSEVVGFPEYSGEDDRRFRPNVTGDSAGSALLRFFTLVGHDQSTFGPSPGLRIR